MKKNRETALFNKISEIKTNEDFIKFYKSNGWSKKGDKITNNADAISIFLSPDVRQNRKKMMAYYSELYQLLVEVYKIKDARGISQVKLAEMSGISQTTLGSLINAQMVVSYPTIVLLFKALDLNLKISK